MGKITINYDFFNEILNAREPLNAFKVLRTNKKVLTFQLAYVFFTNPMFYDADKALLPLIFRSLYMFSADYVIDKVFNDPAKRYAEDKLKSLIPMLNDINISTNYELLLDSKLDSKNYEIQKDDNNKKILVQNKYIMVPTHNPIFNDEDETQMTSIHQEHIIGTKDYSLSVGINQKNKQKILSPLFSTAKR